jgi:hypothetical protein
MTSSTAAGSRRRYLEGGRVTDGRRLVTIRPYPPEMVSHDLSIRYPGGIALRLATVKLWVTQ